MFVPIIIGVIVLAVLLELLKGFLKDGDRKPRRGRNRVTARRQFPTDTEVGGEADNSLIARKQLLTDAEVSVLALIEEALPGRRVFAQVAMGALLKPTTGLDASQWASVRGRFSQKICDFVIVDEHSGYVLAVVELDDATHNTDSDTKRDAMLAAGGYSVIRFPSRPQPNLDRVAAALDDFTVETR